MGPARDDQAEPWRSKDAPALTAARGAVRALVSPDTKFRAYFRVLDTPVLSELYVRSRGRLRNRRIQARTRVVIEAFPSSGSTYCRQAFLLANPDVSPNDICSHTHSPRVVERAVRAGVPCLVVARDPRDAVASMLQRFGDIRVETAFGYYEHYYRTLLPIRDRFVVAPFTAVVVDFSQAVAECNARFGVAFTTPAEAGISSEMVFDDIDRRTRSKRGGEISETTVSRPTTARRSSAEVLHDLTADQRQAMEQALDAFHAFVESP